MAILSRDAYIIDIRHFISEDDPNKALEYWLDHRVARDVATKTPRAVDNVLLRSIAEIDELINSQLNAVLHHPKFQKLEATWRSTWSLVQETDGAQNIKIKLLDINWAEVSKDISRASEFDQTQLFQKIYNDEYGTPGGEPYGVLIGDYEVSHRPSDEHPYDDTSTLEGLSQIAAAAFSPFITSASSSLFGMEDFSLLGQPVNLENIFSQAEYIRWRALREKPDSRFIGITLPRILIRRPYPTTPGSYKGIYFYEQCSQTQRSHYLWGNASYAFARILIREFSSVGWFGHIRGVPRNQMSGGLMSTLPVDCFGTDMEGIAHKPVTDVIVTDAIERELSELGFIPLCQCYNSPYAAFYNNQSVQQPKTYGSGDARINAKLSAMIQHILCASRIAHYIKIMIRDKVGSFISASECESFLKRWLDKYTTSQEDLDWNEQSRYPLREAAVQVKEHPHKPGQYVCVIHLRPHYQLDHMVSELELVTELASIGIKA